MCDRTILQTIYIYSKLNGSKVALISDGIEVTYAQLMDKISRASSFLIKKGLVRGDRVMLSANKELDFVYLYFAAHLLKSICVVVDGEASLNRLEYIQNTVQPKLIIGHFNELDAFSYEEISYELMNENFEQTLNSLVLSDVCDILFTTGTTGTPKGVCLTHFNELSAVVGINEFIQNTEEDIELLALPICHSFGLGRLRCSLYKGATIILLGSFANLRLVFKAIERYGVTGFGMVPSVWNYIKKFSGVRIGNYNRQIKYIEIGSAAMSMENKQMLMNLFPETRICMHYGLTEASRSTFLEFHTDSNHLDSIGKPSPRVAIKFYNDNGEEVPLGVEGELCVCGGHVMDAYLNSSDNQNSHYGDFFRNGDWGYIDEFGYVYLAGRKKELINVGGKKVSPLEVEEAMLKLKGINDCACIGIPDPNEILGEVVKCFLVVDDHSFRWSVIDLRNSLKGKLEAYKLPVVIEYIDVLPMTSSGKKQRLLLK